MPDIQRMPQNAPEQGSTAPVDPSCSGEFLISEDGIPLPLFVGQPGVDGRDGPAPLDGTPSSVTESLPSSCATQIGDLPVFPGAMGTRARRGEEDVVGGSGSGVEAASPDSGAGGSLAESVSEGATRLGGVKPGPRRSDAASPMPSVPGYTLLERLGQGGMGVVFKARQDGLNRIVALKMILGGSWVCDARRWRFGREAEAIAQLQHPHIVQVFDYGQAESSPFVVLEYMPGGSLAARIARKPQPVRASVLLVRTLAEAVEAAHRQGIVHRDLKPENILLDAYGRPKIADFGLAKRMEEPISSSLQGQIIGSPGYMAPEQAGGRPDRVGPSADIYALGAILYELLTGRPPFRAASVEEMLHQLLLVDPTRPSRLVSGIPCDLETIVLHCLEKDPARRYPGARELAEDLNRFLEGHAVLARRIPPWEHLSKWVRRNQALSLVVGLLAAAALAASILAVQAVIAYFDRIDEAETEFYGVILPMVREERLWEADKALIAFLARYQSVAGTRDLRYEANELQIRLNSRFREIGFPEDPSNASRSSADRHAQGAVGVGVGAGLEPERKGSGSRVDELAAQGRQALRDGDPASAIDSFSSALAIEGPAPDLMTGQAWAFLMLGDAMNRGGSAQRAWTRAESGFRRALKAEPDHKEARIGLMIVRDRLESVGRD